MKYRSLGILLVLCASVLMFAGCGAPDSGPTTGVLSGVVFGTLSDTVIPDATVTATNGEQTYTTRTDPSGAYSLTVAPGAYHLVAAMATFNGASADVTVAAGGTADQDLILTTGAGPAPPPLPSDIGASVTGYTVPVEVDMRSLHPGKPGLQEVLAPKVPAESNAYRCSVGVYLSMLTTDAGYRGIRVYESATKDGVYAFAGGSLFQNGSYETNSYSEWRKDDSAFAPGVTRYYRITLYTNAGETTAKGPYAITFLPPLLLTEPAHNALNTARTPTFRWESLGTVGCYYLTLRKRTGGTLEDAGIGYLSDGAASETTYGSAQWSGVTNPLPGSTTYRWGIYAFQGLHTDGVSSYVYSYSYPREFTTQP